MDEALRNGAISRGSIFSEEEAIEAERIAPEIRSKALRSGDEKLLKLLNMLPDMTVARLKNIMDETQ